MELIYKKDALHAVLHNEGQAAVAAVQNIKAVDAVPVVHGEWIRTDDNICYAHICSVCRKHVRVCIGLRCHDCDTEANYCPNCGARMDGKENADGCV